MRVSMLTDAWQGLAVYRSETADQWQRQEGVILHQIAEAQVCDGKLRIQRDQARFALPPLGHGRSPRRLARRH